jgi:hypothetical protein
MRTTPGVIAQRSGDTVLRGDLDAEISICMTVLSEVVGVLNLYGDLN